MSIQGLVIFGPSTVQSVALPTWLSTITAWCVPLIHVNSTWLPGNAVALPLGWVNTVGGVVRMRKSVAMASVQLGLSLTWATSSAQRGTTPKVTSVGRGGQGGQHGRDAGGDDAGGGGRAVAHEVFVGGELALEASTGPTQPRIQLKNVTSATSWVNWAGVMPKRVA